MTTAYRRPRGGFAVTGPQLTVAGSPPKTNPPHVFVRPTARPLTASSNATVMLPVAPPRAISDP